MGVDAEALARRAIQDSMYTGRVSHGPVPGSTNCVWAGVAPPPTLTLSDPLVVVAVVGRKVTLIVQLAPAARVAGNGLKMVVPQLLVCANRFEPPIAIFVSVSGTVPELVTTTSCG